MKPSDIRRQEWIRETVVSDKVTMLHYDDGEIGVSHECLLPRSGYHVLYAPSLQLNGGHTVVSMDPLTIMPSILCYECGLHGFVTDGKWMDC